MSPEFREREASGASGSAFLVCMKCCSDYMIAARGECGCREANRAAGMESEFLARIGEEHAVDLAARAAASAGGVSREEYDSLQRLAALDGVA